jgi:hypothetical protein
VQLALDVVVRSKAHERVRHLSQERPGQAIVQAAETWGQKSRAALTEASEASSGIPLAGDRQEGGAMEPCFSEQWQGIQPSARGTRDGRPEQPAAKQARCGRAGACGAVGRKGAEWVDRATPRVAKLLTIRVDCPLKALHHLLVLGRLQADLGQVQGMRDSARARRRDTWGQRRGMGALPPVTHRPTRRGTVFSRQAGSPGPSRPSRGSCSSAGQSGGWGAGWQSAGTGGDGRGRRTIRRQTDGARCDGAVRMRSV